MTDVTGAQMSITFDMDFNLLADALDLPEDKIRELWDDGKLGEKIREKMSTAEIVELAGDKVDDYGGVDVGSGYR